LGGGRGPGPATRAPPATPRRSLVRDPQRPGGADDSAGTRLARPAGQVRRGPAPGLVRDAEPVPHRRDGRRTRGGRHPVRLPRRPPPPPAAAGSPPAPPPRPGPRPAPRPAARGPTPRPPAPR